MSSKYDKVFEARGVTAGAEKAGSRKGPSTKRAAKKGKTQGDGGGRQSDGDGTERKRRGRPYGKRSDPDYVGFTTYIRKATHKQVKRALLEGDEDRELSELVEDLLVAWLKSRG